MDQDAEIKEVQGIFDQVRMDLLPQSFDERALVTDGLPHLL